MKTTDILLTVILSFFMSACLPARGDASKVYGCYENGNGRMRMINDYSECLKSEKPLPFIEITKNIEEHCFDVAIEDGTHLGILKLELSPVGEEYYIVRGKAYYDSEQVIRGSAAMYGMNILLSATYTSKEGSHLSTSTSRAVIDPVTYNGISRFVTLDLDYSDMSIKRDYGTASLISTSCPE